MDNTIRLLIVQYAGDYRETFLRLAAGGDETYYAQQYSVDTVAALGPQVEEVATLCCLTDQPYNERLADGIRAIGAGLQETINATQVLQLIIDYNPTHLILRTPIQKVLNWAIRTQVNTLVIFAESIPTKGLKAKIRNLMLSRTLNHPQVKWVGSYGLTASHSLSNIGVHPQKIIPWDFCIEDSDQALATKSLRQNAQPWHLIYIGSLCIDKGVGDLLIAMAILKTADWPIHLQLVGRDDNHYWSDQVTQLQLDDCVDLPGIIPTPTVVPQMREADLVIVPSRHNYPEGFPLVITHALSARTPVIAADHPMFIQHLQHQHNAMIFTAENPASLANSIQTILSNPDLYQHISQASEQTYQQLQVPVKFADLINRWLFDSAENQQWLGSFALANHPY